MIKITNKLVIKLCQNVLIIFIIWPLASTGATVNEMCMKCFCEPYSSVLSFKSHFERFQIVYAGGFAAAFGFTLFLAQQIFQKYWSARNASKRMWATVIAHISYYEKMIKTNANIDNVAEPDLSWVVKSASDAGVSSKEISEGMEAILCLYDLHGSLVKKTDTLYNLEARLVEMLSSHKVKG